MAWWLIRLLKTPTTGGWVVPGLLLELGLQNKTGLAWLLFFENGKRWRILGWLYVTVFAIL